MIVKPSDQLPRKVRRQLRKGLARIEGRAGSRHEGIGFHVAMAATVHSAPSAELDATDIAREIRIALRRAAADALQYCEAFDLSEAQDVCARELSRRRFLPTDPPVEYSAFDVQVTLLPSDRAAAEKLLAVKRARTAQDAVRRQEWEARIAELSDPASVFLLWLDQQTGDWADEKKAPDDKRLTAIADLFARYRPTERNGAEYALVEVVRQFLDSFDDPAQKKMLYGLLAGGMEAAGRPLHADRARSLYQHFPAEAAGVHE
ncbi:MULTISPECIES: hypothetical protein [unclassified Streptomyces]|uniref:hypothetical protein n=1 Tax=unclassified Streptomyces TaxID=2593676 RepID=UPI0033A77DC1